MAIGVTTDCVCDLPDEYMSTHDIGAIYFYITTDRGKFQDGYEITSDNIIEYLGSGGQKAVTAPPSPEEYVEFFKTQLKRHSEIIHITISSDVSEAKSHALAAVEKMDKSQAEKIHILDSWHLSTGMGHMIIYARQLIAEGKSAKEIVERLEQFKKRVSTSFITNDADYLNRNGRVSKNVAAICSAFRLHPVLTMKNGKMALKSIKIGSFDRSVMRYIRDELRRSSKIDRRRVFITHACCSVKTINSVKELVASLCPFDEVVVTKASATVSGNCGPGTIGILYVYNE